MSGDLGNKQIFADNLNYYMELNGKSRVEVCSALGFPYTTFCDWCNARKYPRIDRIEMLANYFGINKSDLVEERGKHPIVDDTELNNYLEMLRTNENLRVLFDAAHDATPAQLEAIVQMLQTFKQNN